MGLSHIANEDFQHPANIKSESTETDVLLITLYNLRSVLKEDTCPLGKL
jgi:hypothetical protein